MLARRIDHTALWIFAAFSSFLLMFILTDGKLIRSFALSALVLVILILLSGRLPDAVRPSRRARRAYAVQLVNQWIFEEEPAAIASVRAILPELLSETDWNKVHLVRRFPDNNSLSANDVLELWRLHRKEDCLIILSTCPADASCLTLISRFNDPTIRLIDSASLIRRLTEKIKTIPGDAAKKEQRPSILMNFALFVQRLRPFRTTSYLLVFAAGFLFTGGRFYLAAAVLFSALLIARSVLIKRLHSD